MEPSVDGKRRGLWICFSPTTELCHGSQFWRVLLAGQGGLVLYCSLPALDSVSLPALNSAGDPDGKGKDGLDLELSYWHLTFKVIMLFGGLCGGPDACRPAYCLAFGETTAAMRLGSFTSSLALPLQQQAIDLNYKHLDTWSTAAGGLKSTGLLGRVFGRDCRCSICEEGSFLQAGDDYHMCCFYRKDYTYNAGLD